VKVLKAGRQQKGWTTTATCTGGGNGGGGCKAKLLVQEGDLFQTASGHYDGSVDYFVTFKCPACEVLTDIENYPKSPMTLPKEPNPDIKADLNTIRPEDFAFSIDASDSRWDVYRFTKDGKRGTLAFTQRDGKFVIGVFAAGELTTEEVAAALVKAGPSPV
jgi:hypothetical protein